MTSTMAHSVRPARLHPASDLARPERPSDALVAVLEQLQGVVGCLRDEQYAMKPVGVVNSSIGGHVRHCLDHVRALLNAVETGELDYDHRDRDTPIESDRAAALHAIRVLHNKLLALDSDDILEQPVRLSILMTADGAPIDVGTTIGREMAYVLSHTIHHNALIGTMVKILGGWLPDRFGYAPSTLAHMKTKTCAR
jgi:uncharacterized damage-inducible protein DinB